MELIIDKKQKTITFNGTITTLLKSLSVMREEVVVKVNGKLAPETKTVSADDKVEIIKVVFGG